MSMSVILMMFPLTRFRYFLSSSSGHSISRVHAPFNSGLNTHDIGSNTARPLLEKSVVVAPCIVIISLLQILYKSLVLLLLYMLILSVCVQGFLTVYNPLLYWLFRVLHLMKCSTIPASEYRDISP